MIHSLQDACETILQVRQTLAADCRKHAEASRFRQLRNDKWALRVWDLEPPHCGAERPETGPRGNRRMKLLDAIKKVLETAGQPLPYKEITKQVLNEGLWKSDGKTPEATINSRLAVDMKRNGKQSRFQRTEKGVFALRAWGLPEYKGKKRPGKSKAAPPAKTMSFTSAAEYVLGQFGQKKPMHYRAITDKALELGLVKTAGKTPEATLYAQVITEIQRRKKQGVQPRFVKYPKGYMGLTKWQATGLAFQIQQHNKQVHKKLHEQISKMDPTGFEELIGKLLAKLGFDDVTVTSPWRDGGIDVRGTLVTADVIRTRMALQAKKWKQNVRAPVVQQVRGSLGTHEQGLIITTSDFGKGARAEAERPDAVPVALMNGEQLVKLLVENDIGVRRTAADLIELGEAEDEE